MKSIKLLTAALSLAAAAALQATPIDFLASADGIGATSQYNFTSNGTVVLGNKNSVEFVGVKSVGSDAEINSSEWLAVNLLNPDRLASLSFALLFNGPEYTDVNEIAQATTSNGDVFQLRLTAENTADWYKNGDLVTSVTGSGTSLNQAGLFTILNPFGYGTITSFTLTAIDHADQIGSPSDFGLYSFTTVPDSGSTLALMGALLLGFAGLSRRFRR